MPLVASPEPEVWQGDIFSNVPWGWVRALQFVELRGEHFVQLPPFEPGRKGSLVVRGGIDAGMLVSHECVVGKGQSEPYTFARVILLEGRPERMKVALREGRQKTGFYLPPVGGVLEESYVDFRILLSLAPDLLAGLRKIASLSEQGRNSLREQLIRHWTHPEERPPD